jgi:hypothetical protein
MVKERSLTLALFHNERSALEQFNDLNGWNNFNLERATESIQTFSALRGVS